MSRTLVLATANPGKVAEITALLTGWDLRPRPDRVPDVVEDADTLEGNARLKATAICTATGLPALADDTGLEVAALGGAPGVHSARYAGPEQDPDANMAKLLAALDDESDRTARFRTVVLVAYPDGREVVAEGAVEGSIALAPAGPTGFGYDPVFVPDGDPDGRSFSQMSPSEKNAISHRGRALRALRALLEG